MYKTGGFLSYSPEKSPKLWWQLWYLLTPINHGLNTVIDTLHEPIDDINTPYSSGNGEFVRQEKV